MNKILTISLLLFISIYGRAQDISVFDLSNYDQSTTDVINLYRMCQKLEKKVDSLAKIIKSFHQLEGLYPAIFQKIDPSDLPTYNPPIGYSDSITSEALIIRDRADSMSTISNDGYLIDIHLDSALTIALPAKQFFKDRRYYKRHGCYPHHKPRRKNPNWVKEHAKKSPVDTKE